MLFHVYGGNALYQWGAMILVLVGLILLNEVARRTKLGGLIIFGAVPVVLTIYFIVIAACAAAGQTWAVENQTHVYMNGWFHYMKLYASLAGCIGFMMIKYGWGIGKTHWFKAYPFVIVAINILIAVASDFESAINGWYKWWLSCPSNLGAGCFTATIAVIPFLTSRPVKLASLSFNIPSSLAYWLITIVNLVLNPVICVPPSCV